MGVYIPNMEKPKECYECPFYDSEYPWACEPLQTVDGYKCPLIDIVQCKECINWNAEDGVCNQWSDPHEFDIRETDPDGFCYYGERRAE